MSEETPVFEILIVFRGDKKSVKFEIPYEEGELDEEMTERVNEMIDTSQETGFLKFDDIDGETIYINIENIDVIRF